MGGWDLQWRSPEVGTRTRKQFCVAQIGRRKPDGQQWSIHSNAHSLLGSHYTPLARRLSSAKEHSPHHELSFSARPSTQPSPPCPHICFISGVAGCRGFCTSVIGTWYMINRFDYRAQIYMLFEKSMLARWRGRRYNVMARGTLVSLCRSQKVTADHLSRIGKCS